MVSIKAKGKERMDGDEPSDRDLKNIESHEWHLWYLAFALILFLGILAVTTYLLDPGGFFEESESAQTMAKRALGGFSLLIFLFCAYVVQTRVTFEKLRGIIQKQTTHDILTNLYNRAYFNSRIQEELGRAKQYNHGLGILLCDLDHFTAINDTLGHQGGDEVLQLVAKSIQEVTRGTDLVFRWGADEMMVVSLLDTKNDGVLMIAERIRKNVLKIAKRLNLDMDLSIGIAIYPSHGKSIGELVRIVDRALNIAKKGGDKVHIGDEDYRLDEEAIRIVFQPVFDIWSDEVLGYEALGRDPQGKLSILDLFKKYKAIGQLNDLKRICFGSELRIANECGLKRVFINVDFNMLRTLDVPPIPTGMRVILEISEGEVLDDVDHCLEVVSKWRAGGYQIAIDDFGAGFISLPFVARLIPEFIKLDRSTILHAVASLQFRGFLKKLIPALRMYAVEGIIAEGVETEEQLDVVKDLGIFSVQGFLLGRPKDLQMRVVEAPGFDAVS